MLTLQYKPYMNGKYLLCNSSYLSISLQMATLGNPGNDVTFKRANVYAAMTRGHTLYK